MNDYNPAPATGQGGISAEERQWGMFAHLSALIGLFIPLANVIAPLVIWQIKKDTMPFASEQAKESLNFQITVLIAAFISAILIVILVGIFLLFAVGIAAIILTIIAGVKANEGVAYRYPFTLRLVN